MTEWLILISIMLVGVILILSLRKFSELTAEVSIFRWISLKLTGRENRASNGGGLREADIRELLGRYNEDFCKAVISRDIRYLSATVTQPGLTQAKRHIETLANSMQRLGWVSCRLVAYSLADKPRRSGKQIIANVDETWEYRFADGQRSQTTARNIYTLVLVDNEWRVESCELLTPFMANA